MSDERVMVPREPTAEMLVAMALKVRHDWGRLSETDKHNILHQVRQIYRAMLDAAPAAPQQAAHNAREINNLVGKTDSQQAGPVWMRPDQLQKARHAPFLCRVSPTKDAPDLMPMFLHPPAAEVQRLREALEYLIEKCGDSDDAQYSTLGTKFVRDIARRALEGGE